MVEILIVVAIVGILAGGLITIIDPAGQLKGSRDSKRKADLKQIQAALELYRADQGSYPDASVDSNPDNSVANCDSGTTLKDDCSGTQATYLQSVPKDPKSSAHYYYCTSSTCGVNSGYRIYACIEKSSDPDRETGSTPSYLGCPTDSFYMYVTNP